MLSMKMPESNVYKLIILIMMHFILTSSLSNEIKEICKLKLIYFLDQKLLSLFDLEPYSFKNTKSNNIRVIPKTKGKVFLLFSPYN